jgi:hypothetical protein
MTEECSGRKKETKAPEQESGAEKDNTDDRS